MTTKVGMQGVRSGGRGGGRRESYTKYHDKKEIVVEI